MTIWHVQKEGFRCREDVRQQRPRDLTIITGQDLRVDSSQRLLYRISQPKGCVMKNDERTKENTMWKLVSGTILYHERLGAFLDFWNSRRTMFSRYNT